MLTSYRAGVQRLSVHRKAGRDYRDERSGAASSVDFFASEFLPLSHRRRAHERNGAALDSV